MLMNLYTWSWMCACLAEIHAVHVLVPVLGAYCCFCHHHLQHQYFHFCPIHHHQPLCDLANLLHSHHHLHQKSMKVPSDHHLYLKSVLLVKMLFMAYFYCHLQMKSVLLVKMVFIVLLVFQIELDPQSKHAFWCAHCTGTVKVLLHCL